MNQDQCDSCGCKTTVLQKSVDRKQNKVVLSEMLQRTFKIEFRLEDHAILQSLGFHTPLQRGRKDKLELLSPAPADRGRQ